MKAFLALLLFAALCFAEPTPAVPTQAAPAESAESAASAAPESHAEVVESAAPDEAGSPSEPKPHAETAKPQAPRPARSGDRGAQRPPCRAEVRLVDGSLLKGTLRPRFLPAVSPSLGRVRIDLSTVESIKLLRDPAKSDSTKPPARRLARISFKNGDRLTATLSPKHDHFVFATLLGPLQIPLSAVRSISFNPSASRLQPRTSHLLYHCTFDSPESIAHPAAGPAGRFLGGEFVPGKKGRALRIPGNVPTALVDLPRGMMQPRGTIEFWSKIEDPPASYGDRGNPRFFGLSLFDDPANPGPYSTYLQFTSNDGMGMSGLCGMIYHRAMATDPHMRTNTYGPILEDPAAWHHYAIVWDSDGLSFSKASDGTPAVAAIVLDGRVLQTLGRNQLAHGKGLLRLPELKGRLAFPVEDTGWGFFPRPVAFLIDEFKIWSAPKTDFAIPPATTEPPRILYHCTFDDAAAIERPTVGPFGTFLGGTFEDGKSGNALRIRKGLSSAIVHFGKGVLQPRGTIEFWAKIENDREMFGDGGDPRFFMIETAPGSETVFQLAANDGCGRGGISIYHQGFSVASEGQCLAPARYDSVLPDPTKDWHHYSLVWDENGVPGLDGPVALAAFIDGKRIPLHGDTGLAKTHHMASRFRDNPATLFFSLNPELNRGFNNKSDFLIDEFKIWSAPKLPFRSM